MPNKILLKFYKRLSDNDEDPQTIDLQLKEMIYVFMQKTGSHKQKRVSK